MSFPTVEVKPEDNKSLYIEPKHVYCALPPTTAVWAIIRDELMGDWILKMLLQFYNREYPDHFPFGWWTTPEEAHRLAKTQLVDVLDYPPYESQGLKKNHPDAVWVVVLHFGILVAKAAYAFALEFPDDSSYTAETRVTFREAREFFHKLRYREVSYGDNMSQQPE